MDQGTIPRAQDSPEIDMKSFSPRRLSAIAVLVSILMAIGAAPAEALSVGRGRCVLRNLDPPASGRALLFVPLRRRQAAPGRPAPGQRTGLAERAAISGRRSSPASRKRAS